MKKNLCSSLDSILTYDFDNRLIYFKSYAANNTTFIQHNINANLLPCTFVLRRQTLGFDIFNFELLI